MSKKRFGNLTEWLAENLDATSIKVLKFKKLSGGAIQENWFFDLLITGGRLEGKQKFVLRTDASSTVSASHSRAEEFQIHKVAYDAGICVPMPIVVCSDNSVIGSPFYLMEFIPGFSSARQIVRNLDLPNFGPNLVKQLGQELAKIHQIQPSNTNFDFLKIPESHPADERISVYRGYLDELLKGFPVLEYALNWLEENKPHSENLTLVHSDFRTGNYLILDGQLKAVLDWEFSHWGDPMEDIGWVCARCWRFGNDHLHVTGIGTLSDFLKGYGILQVTESFRKKIAYWQVMAETRWSIIALQQAQRNQSEVGVSLELALTGRMSAEMEYNLLTTIAGIEEV